MPHYYILGEDNTPIPVEDPLEWAEKLSEKRKRVGNTTVGRFRISTVFLGIDHSLAFSDSSNRLIFGGSSSNPILFETMIFDISEEAKKWEGLFQTRYSTWKEAEEGHRLICRVIEAIFPQR